MSEPLVLTLPTVAGPRGSILPDWRHAPGGVAPGHWVRTPDQPQEAGMVRVRVAAARATPVTCPDTPARIPLPVRRRACRSLGPKAKPDCACADRVCLAGKGVVRHVDQCQACKSYAPPA